MSGSPDSKVSPKQAAKMHRRSRSGCFTCRLRRKKCDEAKPACKACKHLGLKCEYKRPMWWSNNEQRKQQKETIKNIIRHTKLSEKTAQMMPMGADTPPDLSHSLPTSDTYSDTLDRTRSVSVDSHFSLEYDFNAPGPHSVQDPFGPFNPSMHQPLFTPQFPPQSPYEVDVKTERQMFVNDVPTRRDSSISSFSTFQPPRPHTTLPSFTGDSVWSSHEEALLHHPDDIRRHSMSGAEEPLDFNFFTFDHAHPSQVLSPSAASPPHQRQAVIHVEECDRPLLDHFIDHVLRLIFPVLEVNQHGLARSEVILPALESNRCYLHCCLSISALHLKATQRLQSEQIDNDIMRHRYATISELCTALDRDTDHLQILEATLGMIFFQCSVGRPDDCLPDIPWHQHFQAAQSLVHKLELPRALIETDGTPGTHSPFNMTLTSWIDILGATMLGRAPCFADTYREKHMANAGSGLSELMGCEDRVMYLISEISCLEALKLDGMDDMQLCGHISLLAQQIDLTEPGPGAIAPAVNVTTGVLHPRQLGQNMTAMFRLAARIYLCSLVPGFSREQASITELVSKLAACLEYIPGGAEGFDRSLVWPLLIGGAVATPSSPFRSIFQSRIELLGEHADFGSFGRMRRLLLEVWRQADERGENVPWRDVMRQNGWDVLLI
ncbi:MAG: hypothetical protein M4579_003777 [Chaenotheca gracillima]|nr:MAG: hypothetical protein M4579_003777 [Chaenotheca gracillima]